LVLCWQQHQLQRWQLLRSPQRQQQGWQQLRASAAWFAPHHQRYLLLLLALVWPLLLRLVLDSPACRVERAWACVLALLRLLLRLLLASPACP
jgi:hypothetical protein